MSKIVSVFLDRVGADFLINNLLERGYPVTSMSIILKEDIVYLAEGEKGGLSVSTKFQDKKDYPQGINELLYEFGLYLIPGIGSLIIAGPILKYMGVVEAPEITVSGATTGILAGGLSVGLEKMGVPEEDAKHFERIIKNDGVLLLLSGENIIDFKKIIQESDAKYIRKINLS